MDSNLRIDGIIWNVWVDVSKVRHVQPLCPIHSLRLHPVPNTYTTKWGEDANFLKCEDCEKLFTLNRTYSAEKQYVLDRIDAKVYKGMKVLNLDDEATPVAKDKVSSKNGKYFITAQLMESKRGIQAVIYAGERGKPQKTQILVEPSIKRLAFDQNDLHPSEVFLEITGKFIDGTSNTISRNNISTQKTKENKS